METSDLRGSYRGSILRMSSDKVGGFGVLGFNDLKIRIKFGGYDTLI